MNDIESLKAKNKEILESLEIIKKESDVVVEENKKLLSVISRVFNEAHSYQEDLEGYQILNILEELNNMA